MLFDNLECVECGLFSQCNTPRMKPEGNLDSEILIVAEAPGENEDILGRPLIGESGQILRHALVQAGIEPAYTLSNRTAYNETPYATNVVMSNVCSCRPPNNATPNSRQIKCCFPNVLKLIDSMPNLKLIVAVGNIALRAFIGKQGISKLSGTELEWEYKDTKYKLMPLIHPASFLYAKNRNNINVFYEHVARILSILHGKLVTDDFGTYHFIKDINSANKYLELLKNSNCFIFDLETSGLNPFDENATIKVISFSVKPKDAFVLDLSCFTDDELHHIINELRRIFGDASIGKIAHNVKFDVQWLKAIYGIETNNVIGDTQLSQYILYPDTSMDLKDMAYQYTGVGGYEKSLSVDVQNASGDELLRYSAIDSDVCHRIYLIHKEQLNADKEFVSCYNNLLLPTQLVLANMEYTGIRIDPVRLNKAYSISSKALKMAIDTLKSHPVVVKYCMDNRVEFNPNSGKQVRELLFSDAYENLTPKKFTSKTKSPATDKTVLAEYKNKSEVAKYLHIYSQHKALEKIFQEIVANIKYDHRVHTTFWLTSTKSGRSSSSSPNLQNIPKGEKDAVGMRKAFVADKGFLLLECDYNQHELRCMADEADDEELRRVVLSGDAHRAQAANILGISPSDVTEEQRRTIGKSINFGSIYGMTPFGLMKRMGLVDKYLSKMPNLSESQAKLLAEREATQYLEKFFSIYRKTREWMNSTMEFVKEHRYVKIRTGLKKFFPKDVPLTDHELRSAINIPIQGLAGHILFFGLIGVDKFLRDNKLRSRLVLEVHDSIVMEIHKSELGIIDDVRHIMCTYFKPYVPSFTTPIAVDISIGENWGEMEKVKEK